jgi:hypothetical protein
VPIIAQTIYTITNYMKLKTNNSFKFQVTSKGNITVHGVKTMNLPQQYLDFLNSINWLVSLIGAVILSIIANLVTGPVQNFLARRSERNAAHRISGLQERLKRIELYRTSPEALLGRALQGALHILLYFSFAGAIQSVSSFLFITGPEDMAELLVISAQMISAALYLIGARLGFRALWWMQLVREFAKTESDIQQEISDLRSRFPKLKPDNNSST